MWIRFGLLCYCFACLAGCGTLINLRGTGPYSPTSSISGMPPAKIIYGGTAVSLVGGAAVVVDGISTDLTEIPPGLYLLAIDTPLSAVADTLTLPITIPATIEKLRNGTKDKSIGNTEKDSPSLNQQRGEE